MKIDIPLAENQIEKTMEKQNGNWDFCGLQGLGFWCLRGVNEATIMGDFITKVTPA